MDNITLLSPSAFGSPAAFSTAIRPNSSSRLTGSISSRKTEESTINPVMLELPKTMEKSSLDGMFPSSYLTDNTVPSAYGGFALHLSPSQLANQHSPGGHDSGSDDRTRTEWHSESLDQTPPITSAVANDNTFNVTKEARLWVNKTNLGVSMIGNETEPAIVMEAAEFSLANQTHRQGRDDSRHGNDDDGSSHNSDVKVDCDTPIKEGVVIGERESLLSNEGGFLLQSYLVPSHTILDSLAEGGVVMDEEGVAREGLDDTTGQIHGNPFDSTGDITPQDFSDLNIGVRDTETLLDELNMDEKLLNQQSASETPLSSNGTYLIPPVSGCGLGEGDMSLTTYFGSRSYPLGPSLSADRFSDERPTFGIGQDIVSPDKSQLPVVMETDDTPLLQSTTPINTPTSVPVINKDAPLTPLVATVTPGTANMPLPKLDLATLLSNVSKDSLAPFTSAGVQTPPIVLTTPTTSSNHTHLPLTPTPRGNELPSLYFRESYGEWEGSTLRMSEVSALPITPAPSRPYLVAMDNGTTLFPTPSIADTTKLCNFTVTNTLDDMTFGTPLREASPLSGNHGNDPTIEPHVLDMSDEDSAHSSKSSTHFEESPSHSSESFNDSSAHSDRGVITDSTHSRDSPAHLHNESPTISVGVSHDSSTVRATPTTDTISVTFSALDDEETTPLSTHGDSTPLDNTATPYVIDSETTPTTTCMTTPITGMTTPTANITATIITPATVATPTTSMTTPITGIAMPLTPPSLNTVVAESAHKMVRVKAVLDSTRFDAQTFLASLNNKTTPPLLPPISISPACSLHEGVSNVTMVTPGNESSNQNTSGSTNSPSPSSSGRSHASSSDDSFHSSIAMTNSAQDHTPQLTHPSLSINTSVHMAMNHTPLSTNQYSSTLHDNTLIETTPTDTLLNDTPNISVSSGHAHYQATPINRPVNDTFCTPSLLLEGKFQPIPGNDSFVAATPTQQTTPLSEPLPREDIEVPGGVSFEGVACIHTRHVKHVSIRNKTERWLQYQLEVTGVKRNDNEVSDVKVFECPSKCFIGPHKEETVKVTFVPHQSGSYTAVLRFLSRSPGGCPSLVTLWASAEEPVVKVITSKEGCSAPLDYGAVVAGSKPALPVYLVNEGQADVPIMIALGLDSPSWSSFSLTDPEDAPSAPPTLPSQPHPPAGSRDTVTSIRMLLPGGKPTNQSKGSCRTVMVHFNPLSQSSQASYILPRPQEYSSRIDLFIDGALDSPEATIASVQLKAVVGVARLHAPRSSQSLLLECCHGSVVSQSVPLKNAGNIPLNVLVHCDQSEWFAVKPVAVTIPPSEEIYIQVQFVPTQPDMTVEGNLLLITKPEGPTYQIRLKGVALPLQVPDDGILECNKSSLFWPGVDIGGSSSVKEIVIRNTYSTCVSLEVRVRDPDIFQLRDSIPPSSGVLKISLDPTAQLKIPLVYVPSTVTMLQHSYIDITDINRGKRYKISLFGYGGRSLVSLTNCMHTEQGLVASLQEIKVGGCSIKRLKLTNNGVRAAFVRTVGCHESNQFKGQVTIRPDGIVIHPHQTKEIEVSYSVQDSVTMETKGGVVPLVKLVLYTGDEILRRLVTSLSPPGVGVVLGEELMGHYEGQDTIPSDFDHIPLEGIDTTNILESLTKRHHVLLTGWVKPISPLPPLSLPPAPPTRPAPSRYMGTTASHSRHSSTRSVETPPTNAILPKLSVSFADTVIKEFQENYLEIRNPYSVTLKWRLCNISPAFVKEVEHTGSVFKSKYMPFWVHRCSDHIGPYLQDNVLITFQPHDVGQYSQMWNLQVSTADVDVVNYKISFGGKAVSSHPLVPGQKLFPVVTPVVTTATAVVPPISKGGGLPPSNKAPRHTVYLGRDTVQFPSTPMGEEIVEKLLVYNKDTCDHQFQVIKPHPPFSIAHYEFTLQPMKCARLPIYFTPTEPNKCYESIIGIRTYTGMQMFSILKGTSS